MIDIRQTTYGDLDILMDIFNEARYTISLLGIDQWQDGYPSRSVIRKDIEEGRSYCVCLDGIPCGTFVLLSDGEPTYDLIYDGQWLTGNSKADYIAIHRVAISIAKRGTGIAPRIIEYAFEYAKSRKKSSLRIDTHLGNTVMRRMLEKNGFTYCGVIYLESGASRVAYERLLF